jgi:hypothetical protein
MTTDPTVSATAAAAAAAVGALLGSAGTLSVQTWHRRRHVTHDTAQLARGALTDAIGVLNDSAERNGWLAPGWQLPDKNAITHAQLDRRLRQAQARITNRKFREDVQSVRDVLEKIEHVYPDPLFIYVHTDIPPTPAEIVRNQQRDLDAQEQARAAQDGLPHAQKALAVLDRLERNT